MIVQPPDNQLYGAALLSGLTQSGGNETQRMAVVLKAAYDIVDNGDDPGLMIPTEADERVAIVFADQGTNIDIDAVPSFDVSYEADIALEKPLADVVVRGYMPAPATDPVNGSIQVDSAAWLIRNAVLRVRDTSRNLFGFQPRLEANRKINVDEHFVPSEDNVLPPQYSSQFNNFHRRGGGFTFSGATQLPSAGLVEIHQTSDQSDTPYSFILPDLNLRLRYRFHDGSRPDHEHCWSSTELGAMRADTLIVEPNENRAIILWRGGWDAQEQVFEAYRRVEIAQGGP